jgi:serine O-acetyltransferase
MVGGGKCIIGDNVILFSGAKVIGNVCIGNNVVVGANAVVLNDIPDNAVVAGVPAKIISYNGTKISRQYIERFRLEDIKLNNNKNS